jgi:sugar lactone lactonase YvrE
MPFVRVLLLFLYMVVASLTHAQTVQEYYEVGRQHLADGYFAGYLSAIQSADSLRQNHPIILFELGLAQALAGQPRNARETLKRAIWLMPDLLEREHPARDSLAGRFSFADLNAFATELNQEVRQGQVVLTLPDRDIHPEGIVHHEGYTYVSSVRKGTIMRYQHEQGGAVFGESQQSAMGMAIDTMRQLLWVATTATPQLENKTGANGASIQAFDLASGTQRKYLPLTDTTAWLGDLILAGDGTIYATSSSVEHPYIYRLGTEREEAEAWLTREGWASLQGLCLDEAETHLYVTDYRLGIFRIELSTGEIQAVNNQTEHPLKGIDGLYRYQDWLIAVHNGLRPLQVMAYRLSADGTAITEFRYLEKALPEMGEPTLGYLDGDTFCYLVNSPWGAYDNEGTFIPEKAAQPIIRSLELNKLLASAKE